MGTERFKASVQYGDWRGTSAVDSADKEDANKWLEAKGHKEEGEFLLGIEMYAGENHGVHKDPVYVTFLLASRGDYDSVKEMIDSTSGPVEVKKVSVTMTLAEFFGLFKRFSVAFSSHGILGEREYRYGDE